MPDATIPFDAEKFVTANSFDLVLRDYSNFGLLLRCIDDRASDSEDQERPVAIPGGGLGLVMDVLGAATFLRRSGKHVSIDPREAIAAVERAIGAITFHTDEKSVKNKGVACGGCGHCNGALTDPVKYLLSETDAEYFVEHGLSDLKEKLKERGARPTVYRGAHAAQAVVTVLGDAVGLPSVGASGERVYVYHKDMHELLLMLIAHELLPLLASHTQGVSEEELVSALFSSARERLAVTLGKLAIGLPTFVVKKQPRLVVEAV